MNMSDITISEGTTVTLHFSVGLVDGETIDTTFNNKPATFTVGDGNLLQGFERSLFGLAAGDKKSFVIPPENGFGQHNPQNIQTITRGSFSDNVQLEKGLVVSFSDAQNTELPGVVLSFDDNKVEVDFNHPLAGKEVEFNVEIIAVTPAVKH